MNQGPEPTIPAEEDRLFAYSEHPDTEPSTDLETTVRRLQSAIGADPAGSTAIPADLKQQIWEDLMHAEAATTGGPESDDVNADGMIPRQLGTATLLDPRHRHFPWNAAANALLAAVLILALAAGIWRATGGVNFGFGGNPTDQPTIPFGGAVAQEATPTTADFSRFGHPIIGVWQWDNVPANPGTDISWTVFAAEGDYHEIDLKDRVIIGTWRPTGERTVDLVFIIQEVPSQYLFAPNHVPEANVFRPGMEVVRLTVTVDQTGNTLAATGNFEVFDGEGTLIGTFGYEGTGTRMAVIPTSEATPDS